MKNLWRKLKKVVRKAITIARVVKIVQRELDKEKK